MWALTLVQVARARVYVRMEGGHRPWTLFLASTPFETLLFRDVQ